MGAGALGLSTVAGTRAFAAAQADPQVTVIEGSGDRMLVDRRARELRISCDVTKDASKPGVMVWGKRGQVWFGVYGGSASSFFIFTSALEHPAMDQALRNLGLRSRNQLGPDDRKRATELKPSTTPADYLDGDPVLVAVRFEKDGQIVEAALEDFIEEKTRVQGKEVFKPYTPHWVYHGAGEALQYPSGCVVCPSDCFGGLITDNAMPPAHLQQRVPGQLAADAGRRQQGRDRPEIYLRAPAHDIGARVASTGTELAATQPELRRNP